MSQYLGDNWEYAAARNESYHTRDAVKWFSSFLDTTPKNLSRRTVICKNCNQSLLQDFTVEQTVPDYETMFHYLFSKEQHHYNECTFCEVTDGENVELLRQRLCGEIKQCYVHWGAPAPNPPNQPTECADDSETRSSGKRQRRTTIRPANYAVKPKLQRSASVEQQRDASKTTHAATSNASPSNAYIKSKQSIRKKKRQQQQRAESSPLPSLSSSSSSSSSLPPASKLVVRPRVSQARSPNPFTSTAPHSSSQAQPQFPDRPACIEIPDSPAEDLPESHANESIVSVLNELRNGLGDRTGKALSDIGVTQTDHLRLFSGPGRPLLPAFITKIDSLSPLVRGQLTSIIDQWLQTYFFVPLEVMPMDNLSECLNDLLPGLGDDPTVVDFVTKLGFEDSKDFINLDSSLWLFIQEQEEWQAHRLPAYPKMVLAVVVDKDIQKRGA